MDVDGCSNTGVEIIGSFCLIFQCLGPEKMCLLQDFYFPVENLPQSCLALV